MHNNIFGNNDSKKQRRKAHYETNKTNVFCTHNCSIRKLKTEGNFQTSLQKNKQMTLFTSYTPAVCLANIAEMSCDHVDNITSKKHCLIKRCNTASEPINRRPHITPARKHHCIVSNKMYTIKFLYIGSFMTASSSDN